MVKQKGTTTEQGKYSNKYALTELLICGECGTPTNDAQERRDAARSRMDEITAVIYALANHPMSFDDR